VDQLDSLAARSFGLPPFRSAKFFSRVSNPFKSPPNSSPKAPPAMLALSRDQKDVVYLEIDREGQLRGEPKVKKSSGNELYDQSVEWVCASQTADLDREWNFHAEFESDQ
jgi:hypothetical protein